MRQQSEAARGRERESEVIGEAVGEAERGKVRQREAERGRERESEAERGRERESEVIGEAESSRVV